MSDPLKRADVEASHIEGMIKGRRSESSNVWAKPNFEHNRMDFLHWDPDCVKRRGAEAKPTVENRTQVAINSEGKTVETVKGVKEPLKQGQ